MSSRHRGAGNQSNLPDEHPMGDVGQIALAIVFLVVWVLDTFVFHFSTTLNGYMPLVVRLVLGAINIAVALYLTKASHQLMFQHEQETPSVVRTGVYGIARHPMYLSVALFLLGILLTSLSLAAGVVWVLLIGFLDIIARYEERRMLEMCGEEYRAYMRDVSRWGIRLWPFRRPKP